MVHRLAHYVSYDKFTDSHKAFMTTITSNNEPKYFKQVVQDPKWVEAMKKELQALETNGTWTFEELPKGNRHRFEVGIQNKIQTKWINRKIQGPTRS